jgi:hypothetical protein
MKYNTNEEDLPMYNLIPTPQDFYQADRQAKLMERAAAMAAKGYKAVPFATSDQAYFVDGGKETYRVYLLEKPTCSCPDFARHGDCCKHIFFAINASR